MTRGPQTCHPRGHPCAHSPSQHSPHLPTGAGSSGVWGRRLFLCGSMCGLPIFVDSQTEEEGHAGDWGPDGPLAWDCKLLDPGLMSNNQSGRSPSTENRAKQTTAALARIFPGLFPASPSHVQDRLKRLKSPLPAKQPRAEMCLLLPTPPLTEPLPAWLPEQL